MLAFLDITVFFDIRQKIDIILTVLSIFLYLSIDFSIFPMFSIYILLRKKSSLSEIQRSIHTYKTIIKKFSFSYMFLYKKKFKLFNDPKRRKVVGFTNILHPAFSHKHFQTLALFKFSGLAKMFGFKNELWQL